MSHEVTVNVAINFKNELKSLDCLEQDLLSYTKNYYNFFKKDVSLIKTKISDTKKFIKELDGKKMVSENIFVKVKEISSLVKKIANIKSSLNYGAAINNFIEKKQEKISSLIIEKGVVAILASQSLESEGKELNYDNLSIKIKEIQNQKAQDDEIEFIRDKLEIQLIKSQLPDIIKKTLIQKINVKNSYQELMDLIALIESKEHEFIKVEKLAKNAIQALEEIDFKFRKKTYHIDEKGIIRINILAYKDITKDFVIDVFSDRKMSWQFGNYENHMCDADGEKFRNIALKNAGIKTTDYFITRNHSNSRPIQNKQQQKLKTKD